jgi:hypothetical protein
LQFILGNTGFKGGISHHPNNAALIRSGMQRSAASLTNLAGMLRSGNGQRPSSPTLLNNGMRRSAASLDNLAELLRNGASTGEAGM